MSWLSVNPNGEREEIVQAAMALSSQYPQGWDESGEFVHEVPEPQDLHPEELASLYNNADALGIDVYTVLDENTAEMIKLQADIWEEQERAWEEKDWNE